MKKQKGDITLLNVFMNILIISFLFFLLYSSHMLYSQLTDRFQMTQLHSIKYQYLQFVMTIPVTVLQNLN